MAEIPENQPQPISGQPLNSSQSDESVSSAPQNNSRSGKKPQTLRKKNRAYLERAFPVEYVKNGFNGTRAYLAIRPNASTETARVEASKTLAKHNVKKAIADLLPSDRYHRDIIKKALDQEVEMPMSWGDKHKFLRTSLELKGHLVGDKGRSSVNIGLIIER